MVVPTKASGVIAWPAKNTAATMAATAPIAVAATSQAAGRESLDEEGMEA